MKHTIQYIIYVCTLPWPHGHPLKIPMYCVCTIIELVNDLMYCVYMYM